MLDIPAEDEVLDTIEPPFLRMLISGLAERTVEAARFGSLRLLRQSEWVLRNILKEFPLPDDVRSGVCGNLSACLMHIGLITGERADFDAAVSSARYAVTMSPPCDPLYSSHLNNLASALLARGAKWRDVADLSASIECARHAVTSSRSQSLQWRHRLVTLAHCSLENFDVTRSLRDIKRAESALRDALAATPAGDPDRARRLIALSNALQLQYEIFSDRASLDEAVRLARAAWAASAESLNDLRTTIAMSLGASLLLQFGRDKDGRVLEEAIAVKRSAVVMAVRTPYRLGARMNLCRALLGRHVHQVAQYRGAVAKLKFMRRNDEQARGFQYINSVDATDVMEAIRLARSVTEEMAPSWPMRALAYSLLSMTIGAYVRFLQELDPGPLQRAAQDLHELRRSLAAKNIEYSRWDPARFDTLAVGSLLDERVEAAALAVSCAASPQVGIENEYELGQALLDRFRHAGDFDDLDKAAARFAAVAEAPSVPASTRCRSGRNWAECEARRGRWAAALGAYSSAIALLPALTFATPDQDDQRYRLEDHSGIASDAAAAAVTAEDLPAALRLLEQGRAVIWRRSVSGYDAPQENLTD